MIIQRATPDDLIAYYGTRFDYDSMEAVIAVYDGVIKGVAGVCRWKDKPSIAVTDFHEDVSKKDKVRLVKHSMTLIGQLNEPVWSTCVTDNDAKFLMRLGFTYQNFVGGRAVMKWEPENDYHLFLKECGLTEDQVQEMVQQDDVVSFSEEPFELDLRPSDIHGLGMFARDDIESGVVICVARKNNMRSLAGRYINHAKTPNCIMIRDGSDLYVKSLCDINKNDEITVNYRQVGQLSGVLKFDFKSLIASFPVDLSEYPLCKKIEIVEWLMRESDYEVFHELPMNHFIHGGVYVRELSIPKGTMLTGKLHIDDHVCSLDKGEISIMTEEGVKRFKAPYKFKGLGGSKKLGYAHEDCLFTTYHRTELTDLAIIESCISVDSNLQWIDDLIKEDSWP
jgi:hypothetical protein